MYVCIHTHTYIYIYICGESFPEEIFLNSVQSMCLCTISATYSPFSVSSILYRVYLKLDEFQERVSHNKITNKIRISRLYVCQKFSRYSPTTCLFQTFRFLYVEKINPPPLPMGSSTIEHGETIHRRNFYACQIFATARVPVKGRDNP